jgi:hypothetical protein
MKPAVTLSLVMVLGVGGCSNCPCPGPRQTTTTAPSGGVAISRGLFHGTPTTVPASKEMESTLYARPYPEMDKNVYRLPEHVHWVVLPRYNGLTERGPIVDERLTVVLEDNEKSFWPLIVKMPLEKAEQLERDLARVIAEKKQQASAER